VAQSPGMIQNKIGALKGRNKNMYIFYFVLSELHIFTFYLPVTAREKRACHRLQKHLIPLGYFCAPNAR